jgi:hypothetical protein
VLPVTDDLVTLRNAGDLCPRRRAGKKPCFATLWRWAVRGCRGVKLETVSVGGTLCTTRAALQTFFQRVTAARGIDTSPSLARRTARRRQRDNEHASKRLEEFGI